jgi:prepilin-type N-terminal cleavage/methylation domain-containing protein
MSRRGGPTVVQREERGFTLLEVLVAAAIAALALGVLLQGALASLRSVQVAGHYQEAARRRSDRGLVLAERRQHLADRMERPRPSGADPVPHHFPRERSTPLAGYRRGTGARSPRTMRQER